MKLYKILIVLAAFSAFSVAVNAAGLWSTNMPTQDLNMTSSKIEDLTNPAKAESDGIFESIWGGARFLSSSFLFIKEMAYAALDIDGLMRNYGIPSYFITMFYGMLLIVVAFGLIKIMTGRNDKGMD